jgi:hypothetical protein
MLTLKVVMPLVLGDAVNVSVAAVDCPTASVVPCLFHVIVSGPLASGGFQFVVDMLKVIWVLPVFLT